jgi:cellulose synthase operon protein C
MNRVGTAFFSAPILGLLSLGLLPAGCGGSGGVLPAKSRTTVAVASTLTFDQQLDRGNRALDAGRYEEAEAAFASAMAGAQQRPAAELGMRRVYLATGRYALATTESQHAGTNPSLSHETLLLRVNAFAALGKLKEATELVRTSSALDARVLLGETLITQGQREAATTVLMSVIEDYNADRIRNSDALGMAYVGRAAFLLRSPEDANDAFNLAEQVPGDVPEQTLLWRAELFLEHHDAGHAEEVLTEVLERNPHNPEALVGLAKVTLEQALDFEEAKRLVGEALRVNPNLAEAHAVLASVALYDMQLSEAERHINNGLGTNPRNLTLLSLRGATRFLADDHPGFERVRDQVLSYNPQFARFYGIVGTYAEWEHRYDEILRLMNEALVIDPTDAKIHAQLGLNLIRNGDESEGLLALRTAFAGDPYNVRVYNTLNLYEKTIAQKYTSVFGERFNFRYPTLEKPVLEQVVPELLNAAWTKMVGAYAFEPSTPIGIELYSERESFAIRTSGLPQTAIQGVCFGKTLASMSPYHEKFNVGMTLWHELAHVFHIQLSKNHVPRWFTEGLAEYETLTERVEWRREQDLELYNAWREKRLPKVSAMNEAFTHAEDIQDVAVAYYASTQIVHMLAERHGYPKLREMLLLWGQGLRTNAVVERALGVTESQLDAEFDTFLSRRLSRYKGQFTPSQRIGNPDRVREAAAARPKDPSALSRLALLLTEDKQYDQASAVVSEVLKLDASHDQGLWLKARLSLRKGDANDALDALDKLVATAKDGYETQLLLSKAAELSHDDSRMQAALRKAHAYDPLQAEPLYGLLAHARRNGDTALETECLSKLVALEEHNGAVFREYAEVLLNNTDSRAKAVEVGKSAIYADLYNPAAHVVLGKAYEASAQVPDAVKAFDMALVAPGSDGERIEAYKEYAAFCRRHGMIAQAKRLHTEAAKLDASTSEDEE